MKLLLKFSFKSFSSLIINPVKKFKLNSKLSFFYSKSYCSKVNIDNQINEFDKLLDDDEADIDKRIKNLSIKLLSINKSSEVITLFEEKYLKGIYNNINVEELILIIYFYISILERESLEMGNIVRVVDKRIEKCLSMLEETLENIDLTNLLALCWSFSILVTKYNYEIKKELLMKVISGLPNELPTDKKGEIPTLCFSISTLISERYKLLI